MPCIVIVPDLVEPPRRRPSSNLTCAIRPRGPGHKATVYLPVSHVVRELPIETRGVRRQDVADPASIQKRRAPLHHVEVDIYDLGDGSSHRQALCRPS